MQMDYEDETYGWSMEHRDRVGDQMRRCKG